MILSDNIKKKIENEIGADVELLGIKSVETAVASEMRANGIKKVKDYINIIDNDYLKFNLLIEKIVVPKTWFFRNKDSFLYLKNNFLLKWRMNKNNFLNVLSIPCSTGEEPYSIAATLIEGGLKKQDFHIDAFDISQKSISIAKKGVYSKRHTHIEDLPYAKGYIHCKEDNYIVDDRLSETVSFKKYNLMNLNKRKKYDIIFCRNIFIYLNNEAREIVLENLKKILKKEGVIFTGHAEIGIFLNSGFNKVNSKNSFVCKIGDNGNNENIVNKVHVKRKKRIKKRVVVSNKQLVFRNDIEKDKKVLKNDNEELLREKIINLSDSGKYDEAMALCNEYLNKYSLNAEIFCIRGLIYQLKNDFDEAENDFTKAIYLDPYYYEALLHKSNLLTRKGKNEKAEMYRVRAKRVEEREYGK